MPNPEKEPVVIVFWKMKAMDGDAAWHIRQFREYQTAANFAATQKARSDIEHVREMVIR